MNVGTEITRALILDLLKALSDHHGKIQMSEAPLSGGVMFEVKVHLDDHGQVVGKNGSHIKAIKHLLSEIASAQDSHYILNLASQKRIVEKQFTRPAMATQYDESELVGLLSRTIEQILGHRIAIGIDPMRSSTHIIGLMFILNAGSDQDYEDLTVPYSDDQMDQTTVASLGTLWRAFGNKDGVDIKIEIRRP